jgi:hypothetical protein
MCMSAKSYAIGVKLEGTEGTDAVPVLGTDDMFVLRDSPGIDQQISPIQIDGGSPTGGSLVTVLGTRKPRATYRIPMYGMGLTDPGGAVIVPIWMGVCLQSAGVVEVENATPATFVRWHPNPAGPAVIVGGTPTATGKGSFTIYEYIGRAGTIAAGTKILRKMVGCKVVAVRCIAAINQPLVLEIDVLGQYVKDVAITSSMAAWDDGVTTQIPVPLGGTTQLQAAGVTPTVGGTLTTQASNVTYTLDFGGEHVEGDNSGSGVACVENAGTIAGTATVNPVISPAEIAAYASLVDELQHVKLTNSVPYAPQGLTAGYRVTLLAPNAQGAGEYDRGGAALRRALSFALNEDPSASTETARAPLLITIT